MFSLIWNAAFSGYSLAAAAFLPAPWWVRVLLLLAAVLHMAFTRDAVRRLRRATARAAQLEEIAGAALDRMQRGREVMVTCERHPDRAPGTYVVSTYEPVVCDD